jgi:putative membrane protein
MKKLALIAALALPLAAWADDKTNKTGTSDTTTSTDKTKSTAKEKLSETDLQTMAFVHHVNQMEIDMGKLAQTKGTTAGIKDYGKMLVKDHTSADKDLMALAKKNGATIPAFKPTDEADQKEMKDQKDMAAHLKTMKGAEFDKEFLTMMVEGHEKVLAKLDTMSSSSQSPELQTYLKDLKPALQKHADQARDLQKAQPQAMK